MTRPPRKTNDKPEDRYIRLSSGEFRGRKIECPQTGGVRPMLNKTRMALFNVLQKKLKGAVVWDCFAGSGLLGVEAISRGARHSVFVETQGLHARVIQSNIRELNLRERTTVIRGSIFDLAKAGAPKLPNAPADVLLLDPPHAMIKQTNGPFWPWLRGLPQSPLASENTFACIGHPGDLKFPKDLGDWEIQQTRVYGAVAFTVLDVS